MIEIVDSISYRFIGEQVTVCTVFELFISPSLFVVKKCTSVVRKLLFITYRRAH